MKNTLKPLSILTLCLMSILFGSMRYQEILFVPWGEQERELSHAAYPGLHTGPLSFQVDGETVTIFDTENKKLKTFGSEGFRSSETLEQEYVIDFYKDGDILYTLQPQAVYVKENGLSRCVDLLDDPKIMYDGLRRTISGIMAIHGDEVSCLGSRSLKKEAVSAIRVTRSLPASVNIDMNGETYSLHVPDVGSVEYIASTPDQKHYIYAERIIQQIPLKVKRMIYLIDNDANILNTLYLPDQKFTYVFKEFFVNNVGDLYHMQSSKDGIHILKWVYIDDDLKMTEYPDTFSESYHFNDFILPEPVSANPPFLAKVSDAAVTRAEAIAIGGEYVTHTWTATSANIGTTSTVTTPSWIVVGQNTRVPYKWGGWSTIQQFDDGIAAGKLAGDINTSVVDWGNSVGADCSGFVSVCWRASQKYGTSTIHNCSYQLSNYNNLLPGDATNKAGSHIRLFVEWTSDGRLRQVEETASGTPGWAARYYTWRLSDITSYVPIRYNNIQNSLAPRPTLLSVVCKTDSVTLSWIANEGTIFSGYRIYGRTAGEDFSIHADVPKGTLSVTIPQIDDFHYQYFVAAYTSDDSANYNPSDVYAVKRTDSSERILVVDGFDRTGSWGEPTHSFGAKTGFAMDHWGVNYDACANDAVISEDIDLKDYEMVWWICGDESTDDETFNAVEQDKVEAYLKQGGKFFVSGSEIGWDLDNKGTTEDKAFIHNYLKAAYSEDDAGNYSVNGVSGTDFVGIDLQYSSDGSGENTYPEDYPDVFATSGGSQVVLKYGNGKNAGLAYSGIFPGGTASGKVMIMGFPFETIKDIDECDSLSGAVLQYMGISTTSSIDPLIPANSKLYQNYPNPFNPVTTIQYKLAESADVVIRVFDMKGRVVRALPQGHREAGTYGIIFNGTMLPSGMYVYGLEINGEMVITSKMILMK